MKTKTIVTEITKEELSDLFCTAEEFSDYIGFLYKRKEYEWRMNIATRRTDLETNV